jgi:hypothetical protein
MVVSNWTKAIAGLWLHECRATGMWGPLDWKNVMHKRFEIREKMADARTCH